MQSTHGYPGGFAADQRVQRGSGTRAASILLPSEPGLSSPALSHAPANKPRGRIAFVSSDGNDNEIYVLDLADGSETQITFNTDSDLEPAWSPDGKQIAFVRLTASGTLGIFVIDVASGAVVPVARGDARHPAWSPDGKQLAYRQDLEIFVTTLATGAVTRVTNNDVADIAPVWSKNGKQLAIAQFDGDDYEIVLVNADGSASEIQVTNTSEFENEFDPDWSGFSLVLVRFDQNFEHPDLVIHDLRSGAEVEFQTEAFESRPTWSPNGKQIAFSRSIGEVDTPQPDGIWVMNADGTGLIQVRQTGVMPDWGK
jgi:Tol biopolymer transport system component